MYLSTDKFILALRRFVSSRGCPSIIYYNNGSNFVGSKSCLKNILLEKLKTHFTSISRKFIPPAALWWDRFWEKMVRLMKRILRKVLSRTSFELDEENFTDKDHFSIIPEDDPGRVTILDSINTSTRFQRIAQPLHRFQG